MEVGFFQAITDLGISFDLVVGSSVGALNGACIAAGMTPRELARCIEMAVNGTKSAYPAMQPANAFLKDLETMLRTLVAGAVSPAKKPRAAKARPVKKSIARKPGDRR